MATRKILKKVLNKIGDDPKKNENIKRAKKFKAKYISPAPAVSALTFSPTEQQKPKEELEVKKLPIVPAKRIDTSKGELQGNYKEESVPKYQMPGYKVERPGIVMRHGNRPTLAKVTKPGIVSKVVQKATRYDAKYSEGDGSSSGEFENAETEGRRVDFKGASSLKDLKAQKKYNKDYDEYEGKKKFAKEY